MKRINGLIGLTMLFLVVPGTRLIAEAPVAAPARAALSVEVDKAIRSAVEYFKSTQNPDGSWSKIPSSYITVILHPTPEMGPDPEGGRTALVALSLLSAGESRASPVIVKALEYLQKKKPRMVYTLSLRAAVLSMIGESKREALRDDTRALIDMGYGDGTYSGLYTYGNPTEPGRLWTGHRPDLSNSQYAILGIWYASGGGVPVSRDFWKRVEAAWQRMQNPDGGWPYSAGGESTASMTAAGLTVLYITQDFLRVQEVLTLGKPFENKHIDNGLNWLARNFSVAHNAGKDSPPNVNGRPKGWGRWSGYDAGGSFFIHYMLFGYERAGEASGLTRFGDHIWYDEGARFLIDTQSPKGTWSGSNGEIEDTAFSLLFLARGRDPVPIQKLRFPGRWNNRPRDTARMIQWLRVQIERHVNWQVVNIDQPVEDLFESPVLYAAGNEAINLNDEQKHKLHRYLLEGGLLLCAQEGGSRDFAQSIEKLAAELYPTYVFRNLPPEHPILKGNFQVKDLQSNIRALSNGVRELIVLLPNGDLPARWHSPAAAIQASRESPYLLIGNLVPYANGRTNPKYKGERVTIEKNADLEPRRRVNIARVQLGSNWNPEPFALDRLSTVMWNDDRCVVNFTTVKPGEQPFGNRVKLAWLTITDPLEITFAQDKALREFVRGGGTLLIDIAGGSRDAGQSIERLLGRAFIGDILKPIPIDHPVYAGAGFDGHKIENFFYRRWADEHLPRTKLPRLQGIMVENRLGVIFSNEDLTFGLTGNDTDGVIGYAPETALELMRNLVLFAGFGNPVKQP